MAELGIAILGSGYMGRTYAECITKYNQHVRLVAVAGGRRAPGLAADYGVDYEPTYESLLARPDVDAVLVATPHADHRDQVVQAAERGKHVLVEKPMAVSVADCDAMILTCQQAGVVLEVIQTLRFRGTPARAKELIDAGRIGKVRMIRSQSLMPAYAIAAEGWAHLAEHGGAFLDMGVHNFDILRFWTGSEARRVFAHVTTFNDTNLPRLSAMTQIVFASGAVAQQWSSFEVPAETLTGSQHIYTIVGETGALEVDGYGKLTLSTPDHTEVIWEQPAIDFVNRPLEYTRLEAFANQTQSFVDDVLEGRQPTVSGADGRAAVAIVEAAVRSSETGQAVELTAPA